MATESKLSLVIEAKNFAKRTLRKAGRNVRGFTARARSRFQRLRSAVFSVRGALTALAGVGALAGLAKKTFDLGAEIEETASKYRTVFGPAVDIVNQQMDELARKAGLTDNEFRSIAATSGDIIQGFGASEREAAEFATTMTKLAADMASFNNVPIEETSRAVQSALTGEREQLKRLGVVIRESDVQQRALAQTQKENADSLTQLEKATATVSLIQERMSKALGDLDRTADQNANTARRVAASWRQFRDVLAEEAMPLLGSLLTSVDDQTNRLEDWADVIRANANVIRAWARFVSEAVQFAVQSAVTLVRSAFNVGQAIGNLVRQTFSRLVGTFGNLVVNPIVNLLNGLIEQANRLPGVDIDFKFAGIDARKFIDDADESMRALEANVNDAVDSVTDMGAAWSDMATAALFAKMQTAGVADEAERAADAAERAASAGEQITPKATGRGDQLATGGGASLVGPGGQVAGPGQSDLGLGESGQGFTFEELQRFARMASKGVDVSPVRKLLEGWQAVGFEIAKVTENQRTMQQVMADITTQTITGFANAFQQAAKAAVTGSKSMGEAFRGAMLGALAQVASAMSKFYAARAAAALGEGLLGNPAAFAAAAKFTAASAAFGVLAGVLSGVGAGGGGGGGGGTAAGLNAQQQAAGRREREAVINIEGGLLDMSDPRQQRALKRAMEDLSGRRVVIQGG